MLGLWSRMLQQPLLAAWWHLHAQRFFRPKQKHVGLYFSRMQLGKDF